MTTPPDAARPSFPVPSLQIIGPSGSGITRKLIDIFHRVGGAYVGADASMHMTGLRDTVREEIAFGLEQRGMRDMEKSLCAIVRELGIEHLCDRDPKKLSGGETRLVALASAFVLDAPYILDSPLEGLDTEARGRVIAALSRRECILGAQEPVFDVTTHVQGQMMTGGLTSGTEFLPALSIPPMPEPVEEKESQVVGSFSMGETQVHARSGRITWLKGKNGVGKTTFLRAWALSDPAHSALALQRPSDQVIDSHVRRMMPTMPSCARRVGWDIDGALHPLDLAASDLRLVQIASVIGRATPLVLLDEPDTGLDRRGRVIAHTMIADYLRGGGALVLTSHSTSFVSAISYAAIDETTMTHHAHR